MKPERGQYRSITVVLLDGPDFQELPAEARWVFVCLKCSLGPCGIQVEYPASLVEKLAARTGHPAHVVARALDLLQAKGWVRAERNVVWAVGQLQAEPSLSPNNPNHRPTILGHIKGLPRLGIVGDFIRACRDYFDTPDELVKAYPRSPEGTSVGFGNGFPHPIPHPMGDQGKGQGGARSETEEVSVATQPAGAVLEQRVEPGEPGHNFRSVLGLVISELYLGQRPSEQVVSQNGSVLKALAERWSYDDLARIVQGLAKQRARGELGKVTPRQAISLRWLHDKDPTVDPCQRALDAFYRDERGPIDKKRGGVTSITDLLGRAG